MSRLRQESLPRKELNYGFLPGYYGAFLIGKHWQSPTWLLASLVMGGAMILVSIVMCLRQRKRLLG